MVKMPLPPWARTLLVVFIACMLPAVEARTCSEYCLSAGAGEGAIIGTAPVCKARCDTDCKDRLCTIANTNSFDDSGSGCWSGEKICCCAKKA